MAQSLSKIYVHIIFRTKNGELKIPKNILKELYAYMATILKNLESPAIIIGGMPDHIHILCVLSKNYALKKIVEEVKKRSSKWIKTKSPDLSKFRWQNGYGAFSVSQSQVDVVKKYIQKQEEHHRKRTYREEVTIFLEKYKIDYDNRYFWD